MSPKARKLLTQIGSFALAGGLLYLALRGVDFAEVKETMQAANYWWILPLIGFTLLSIWVRAWRWRVLLEALPPATPEAAPQPISLQNGFNSITIGYMVNYVTPRLGEFVRAANMAARQELRFTRVLGTVVVERVLDMAVFGLALISVVLIFLGRLPLLQELLIEPLIGQLSKIPAMAYVGLTLGGIVVAYLLYRHYHNRNHQAQGALAHRVRSAFTSFKEGLLTLLHTPHRWVLVAGTVGLWFCYWMMAHVPFIIFGMDAAYGLTLVDSWSIMVIGALGFVVPSPGGTGSYHYFTIQALVLLFAVDQDPAASYAILTHGGLLLLYVLMGFLAIVLQGSNFRDLRQTAQQARQSAKE